MTRLSKLNKGALEDADMAISAPKTKAMFTRPRVDTGEIADQDYAIMDFQHKCKFCARGFPSRHGCSIHEARWCAEATVEKFEEEYV